ncbi:MAG: DUF6932 family protein [Alphaproteobacteria bacterium]
MLPAFLANGLLPGGVHHCDLQAFEAAFVWSARRRVLYEQMREGLGVLYDSGYRMLVLGGDFISALEHPAEYKALYDCDPLPIDHLDARLSYFDKNSRLIAQKLWGGHFFPASFRAKGTGATWLHYLSSDAPDGPRGLVALSLI